MKRSLIFLLILALVVVLSGCSKRGDSANDIEARGDSANDIEARKICNFKKVYEDVDVGINKEDDIYVDTTTGVIYFRTWGIDGFTPLYNADGSLKIWDGYKEDNYADQH